MTKYPILFDHDGSIDDILSLILLLKMEEYEVKAITITPADCFIENAYDTTMKILCLLEKTDIPIGIGYCRGENSFPAEWRAKPKILNALPDLISIKTQSLDHNHDSAPSVIQRQLLAVQGKAKVLLTGPCTNLVDALIENPMLQEKISEVVWMAGAFNTRGNVVAHNHDNSAEWNVFWDTKSAKKMLNYNLNITFVPLNATNSVPVSIDFLKKLSTLKESFWAQLACQFWATTLDTIPSYEYTYFMWDVLATSYLKIPNAFKVEEGIEIDIIDYGSSAGKTIIKKGSKKYANVVRRVNCELFYNYIVESLATN
jgi:purine nucleosidase